MSDVAIMQAVDAVAGKEGECWIIYDGIRVNFMSLTKLDVDTEFTKASIPRLGSRTEGSKPTGLKHSGTANFHYNVSLFREIALTYQNEGKAMYFDIQVTNDDPSSAVGKQTVILKNCSLNKIKTAMLDASSDDYMEDTFDFTFEKFEMPAKFATLKGMIV